MLIPVMGVCPSTLEPPMPITQRTSTGALLSKPSQFEEETHCEIEIEQYLVRRGVSRLFPSEVVVQARWP
jgi:hypothetical protein